MHTYIHAYIQKKDIVIKNAIMEEDTFEDNCITYIHTYIHIYMHACIHTYGRKA